MRFVALIPARYDSRRFPGKLLKKLGKKSLIYHTYSSAVATGLFDEVIVVTDSEKIYKEIKKNKGKAILNIKKHPSGTDRIAEAAKEMEADVFINIQGDEPFVNKNQILLLKQAFENDPQKKVDIASLMVKINHPDEFLDSNNVKVVTDKEGFALYFSRAPIPYPRDIEFDYAYKHIGIYAFRKEILEKIAVLPVSRLEQIEKLENLRFLENGFKIKMMETKHRNIGVDTPGDLEKAIRFLKEMENEKMD